ncbi:MAG: hypothetical protein ACOCPQ_05430 [Desulfosudaceae bacterium]
MKKNIRLLVLSFTAVLIFGISAAGAQELSVGYQGLIGSGNNMLSGVSVRTWMDKLGFEGTLFTGTLTAESGGSEMDADLWLLDGQAMYALVEKDHSKFYVGGELGFGKYDLEELGYGDGDFAMLSPLMGAEYNFQELPELGFNWEVAYAMIFAEHEQSNADIDLYMSGINVTLGVHYKF